MVRLWWFIWQVSSYCAHGYIWPTWIQMIKRLVIWRDGLWVQPQSTNLRPTNIDFVHHWYDLPVVIRRKRQRRWIESWSVTLLQTYGLWVQPQSTNLRPTNIDFVHHWYDLPGNTEKTPEEVNRILVCDFVANLLLPLFVFFVDLRGNMECLLRILIIFLQCCSVLLCSW